MLLEKLDYHMTDSSDDQNIVIDSGDLSLSEKIKDKVFERLRMVPLGNPMGWEGEIVDRKEVIYRLDEYELRVRNKGYKIYSITCFVGDKRVKQVEVNSFSDCVDKTGKLLAKLQNGKYDEE